MTSHVAPAAQLESVRRGRVFSMRPRRAISRRGGAAGWPRTTFRPYHPLACRIWSERFLGSRAVAVTRIAFWPSSSASRSLRRLHGRRVCRARGPRGTSADDLDFLLQGNEDLAWLSSDFGWQNTSLRYCMSSQQRLYRGNPTGKSVKRELVNFVLLFTTSVVGFVY